ncbi:MAG: hypothetical protein WA865_09710 [Spirulinaceae cyanobacterium]
MKLRLKHHRYTWTKQFRLLAIVLLTIYLPAIFMIIYLKLKTGVSINSLTYNPISLLPVPYYYGFISKLGVLFWSLTTGICLFAASVLAKPAVKKIVPFFFLASGLITLLLLADDFFLLHNIAVALFGWTTRNIYLGYGTLVVAHLLIFRKFWLQTEFLILICALIFFATSLVFDLLQNSTHFYGRSFLEDGAKFLGILSWFVYYTRVSFQQVSSSIFYH